MSIGTERDKHHLDLVSKRREQDLVDYNAYLRGKRVVFVGPAPNLVGKGLGSFIDEFDVVVRTGRSVPIREERKQDYGGRTQVWYVNSAFLTDYDRKVVPVCIGEGLVWACVRGMLAKERIFLNSVIRTRSFRAHVKGIRKPTIGVSLINELVAAEPAEVYLTGVTFFVNGFSGAHLPGYLTPNMQAREDSTIESDQDDLRVFSHSYHSGDVFVKGLYDEGKVTMSEETLGYLNTALVKNERFDG